ncbi:hypothetical protein Pint_22030 [Pistacia integerrima]|uniref:Uncharacterized protein n=1 Tax=Pistacia integerrima TaxID=434235 RepID=A0ACC0YGC7_9ROSI|nr:hypothetical protein Pint_22030 [Pistacia integerrima]
MAMILWGRDCVDWQWGQEGCSARWKEGRWGGVAGHRERGVHCGEKLAKIL